MQKLIIFINPNKTEAPKQAEKLANALVKRGTQVKLAETYKTANDWNNLDPGTEFAIAMGGDGTFLLTAKQVAKRRIPLLGINFGHLGFLSEYGDVGMEDLAEKLIQQDFTIQERSMLKANVEGNAIYALNDIVVYRLPSANLLYTDLYIDDNLVHSYRSDGIIVSTPTGSTAYALSAGGAVMDPNIHAFQIVPIAAHSLNSRPHVVSDEQLIVLETEENKNNFFIQADGQDLVELSPGATIKIAKAEFNLKLAKLNHSNRSFYSILRDKMKWGSVQN